MNDRTFYAHVADIPSRTVDQAYSKTNLPPLMTLKEIDAAVNPKPAEKPHSHYFKPCPYDEIDVYRVLEIFDVKDPVLAHIVKKALVAGGRGLKNLERDVQEIVDSGNRKLDMLREDRVLCGELK